MSIEQAGSFDLDWRFMSRPRDIDYETTDEWLAGCSGQLAAAGIGVLR